MKRCTGCPKKIRWATTAATGARMPLEEDEDNGNVLLDVRKRAHVFRDHAAANDAQNEDWMRFGPTFYLNHLADMKCSLFGRTEQPAPPEPAPVPAVEQEAWPF